MSLLERGDFTRNREHNERERAESFTRKREFAKDQANEDRTDTIFFGGALRFNQVSRLIEKYVNLRSLLRVREISEDEYVPKNLNTCSRTLVSINNLSCGDSFSRIYSNHFTRAVQGFC